MNLLKELFYLFYPRACITCQNTLVSNEILICLNCRHDLPIICYNNFEKNDISKLFKGKIPIYKAASFLSFTKVGKTKKIIHHLKYKGRQEIGTFIGDWFGKILWDSKQFNEIDYIIPVPLHRKRLRERGYNQLTTFGESLSEQLNIKYLENILIRTGATKTQTFKKRIERFKNTDTKFVLLNNQIFENKHVLLIDDVVTTGATLEACCKELLKTKGIKISIVTMAITQ